MSTATVQDLPRRCTPPMPGDPSDLGESPETYIETYYANGTWHCRRHDSHAPFATGDDELDQIALGSQVARWNRLPHIIRTTTGTIAEILPAS